LKAAYPFVNFRVSTPRTDAVKEFQTAGRKRLYPSITNPNWLVLRKRRELFIAWLKDMPSENLSVLDVGGRIQPYRELLGERCVRYFAIDVSPTPLVDVIGQAECLPFSDRQFDLVLCTQVLEYVPEPPVVVNEIYRTLRTGGFLLLSAPAVFPRDSETEYWRFLPCALHRLLSSFSSVEVVPEGNSLIGFLRTTNVCLISFARPAVLGRLLRFTVVPVLNLLGAVLQWFTPGTDDRFSANYSVLARK
jgi:SAM-dependent methyltransferase